MQFIFNSEEVVLVVLSDEVDGETEVTKAPRATDSMEVSLRILGEVEVDDHIHRDDVNTAGE